jgi:hypothetical protein
MNKCIFGGRSTVETDGSEIRCRKRLGGMLRCYYRKIGPNPPRDEFSDITGQRARKASRLD